MYITMRRIVSDDDATLGVLEVDGHRWGTCEDEFRSVKVAGETRIQAGTYEIKLREDSPMANRYRDRFGRDHKGIPWLQDVPNFTWVYLHVGNDEGDTDGCILVGDRLNLAGMIVESSIQGYVRLQRMIQSAIEHGDQVFIQITDEDRR